MSHADFAFPYHSPSSETAEDFFAAFTPRNPTLPSHQNDHPWDLIYAAAGQVARFKINNNNAHHRAFNQVECGSVWGRQVRAKPDCLAEDRAREFVHESLNVKCTRPSCLPQSAWPPLQRNARQHFSGSGSRVVPGGSSVKRGCAGTGVFLPRHYETPSEPRKKAGSAPVLLPAKVVHALNLNTDELNGAGRQRFFNAFATDYEAVLARRNALLLQQRLTLLRREEAANYEARLPQEWTY